MISGPFRTAPIEADAFCDCSASTKSILDFSTDSESSGHPLDDGIIGRVRKCPKIFLRAAEMSENVPKCPEMSENVRKTDFSEIDV